jgi:hypothetical protein
MRVSLLVAFRLLLSVYRPAVWKADDCVRRFRGWQLLVVPLDRSNVFGKAVLKTVRMAGTHADKIAAGLMDSTTAIGNLDVVR